MKRARGFIVLAALAASFTFGSVYAFGADLAPAAVSATAAVEETAKAYDDVVVTDVSFQNDRSEFLGFYPEIDGFDDLNAAIADLVFDEYMELGADPTNDYTKNHYEVSYTIEEDGRFTTITLNRAYNRGYTDVREADLQTIYILDKETNTTVTAEEMEAIKAELVVASEDTTIADETIMYIPLSDTAEALGFVVEIGKGSDPSISITNDNFATKIQIGVNEYVVNGEKVELEFAPVLEDGIPYVPASFFEKVLGASVVAEEYGAITFTFDDQFATITSREYEEEQNEDSAFIVVDPSGIDIPLRSACESLGYSIEILGVDENNKFIIQVSSEDTVVVLTVDSDVYTVDGEEAVFDSAPYILDGSTYVPLSFLTDVFDIVVIDDGTGSYSFFTLDTFDALFGEEGLTIDEEYIEDEEYVEDEEDVEDDEDEEYVEDEEETEDEEEVVEDDDDSADE